MSQKEEVLATMRNAVVNYESDACKEAALKALETGIDPAYTIMEGLAKGMKKVGVLFDTNEYFVPEVLMCTDTLYQGLEILRPHIKKDTAVPRAKMIIGTVLGDVHDIGKNLVKLMFEAADWEIIDLGRDVPLETFVEKQLEIEADVLAISAMMTTTMMGLKKVVAMMRSKQPTCLIMIGGAPVTNDIADLFGADGYAESAGIAVEEALKMIDRSNSQRFGSKQQHQE